MIYAAIPHHVPTLVENFTFALIYIRIDDHADDMQILSITTIPLHYCVTSSHRFSHCRDMMPFPQHVFIQVISLKFALGCYGRHL